ncbi:MAG: acyl-CoA synthetase [Deltaproteobacteria bacterium]|nr:acyl-CoA synthetase [Deltaproteobacteria bacterium]
MESDELASRPYLAIPAELNIAAAIIDRHVDAGRGAKVAAWFDDRPYTYAELLELSNRFANVLRGLGIQRGDRVMLRLGTNLHAMVAILGTLKLGAVAIPSSFLLRAHEVEKILNNSDAIAAVSTPELAGPIEAVRSRTSLKHLILTAEGGALSWNSLMERASAEFVPAPTLAGELAFIMYTSGTTGEPKGVEHAHRWVLGTGDPVARTMINLTPDDICYQPQDWSFMYPLGSSFFHPLLAGATVVVTQDRFDPEKTLATIARHRVTVFAAVPTIYRLLLAVPRGESRHHLGSLRLGMSAGEALPPDTFAQWHERFGVTIYDGLGQTEGHIFIANQLNMPIRPGSMGKPLRGYEAAVLSDNGSPAPYGTSGHLAIRNEDHPGLALGYRKDHERWAAVNRDGWYYTQDIAYIDEDGYYWYVARADDLIKSRAYLISPKEVESALLEHPAILEAAVVGIPDPALSNKIKAFVTLKPGNQPSDSLANQIREYVHSVIAPYKAPQELEFLNELPKTPNGKILRRELRAIGTANKEKRDG